jgi:hypothetical protein
MKTREIVAVQTHWPATSVKLDEVHLPHSGLEANGNRFSEQVDEVLQRSGGHG